MLGRFIIEVRRSSDYSGEERGTKAALKLSCLSSRCFLNCLSISVLTVANPEDRSDSAISFGADPEVADAQAKLRRIDSLQLFHIARAGFRKALYSSRRGTTPSSIGAWRPHAVCPCRYFAESDVPGPRERAPRHSLPHHLEVRCEERLTPGLPSSPAIRPER